MIRSKLSILGMYNYRPDIFDDFHLPDGVEKDILEPELLSELAELELLYTDADVLKSLIDAWSARRLYAWTKLYATTQLDYNPIWNKDGIVTETEERALKEDATETRNLTSKSARDSKASTHDHGDTYGYNSSNKSPTDDRTGNSSATVSGTGTDTGTVGNDRAETENITRTREEHGNIGVTTTQSMIKEERQISDFDIYAYIIGDFKKRFCLMVY